MLLRHKKMLIVASLSILLIGGSFVPYNFGLTQPLTDIPDYIYSDFGMPQDFWLDKGLELPPDNIAVTLIVLAILVLAHPKVSPHKREQLAYSAETESTPYPAWRAPFKKHKYKNVGAPELKKHPKYYRHTVRHG